MIQAVLNFTEVSEYSSFHLLRLSVELSVTTENEEAIPKIGSYNKIKGENKDAVQRTSPETNQTDMHISVSV